MSGKFISNKQTAGGEISACRLFLNERLIKMNLKIPVTSADIFAVKAMSKNERENLKIAINSARPRSIFENGGDKNAESIICPICGNGSGENHTPVVPHLAADGQTWLYNCFRGSCSFKGDLIKIIATENNLDPKNNFMEILAIGAKLINYGLHYNTIAPKSHYKDNQSARKIEETLPPEYERLAKARENLPTLFKDRENFRGLPADVLERLKWGYLADFNHPKKPFDKYPAVIIPNVKGGILARAVGNVKKMDKISPTAPTVINLFDGNDFILTIVEGAINGASLAYATDFKYSVIAMGSTSDGKNLIEFLKAKYPAQKPKILLMFDNDENDAGKKAAEKLLPELKNAGFATVIKFIAEKKDYDFNDFLQQEGKNALAERFNKIVADAQNDFVTLEKEVAEIADFNKRADEWKIHNGVIDPATFEELRNAEKYFKSLSAEDITAEIILNSKRKIALCKVYGFCELSATEFLAKVEKAITTADNKIRAARKDNSSPPVSAEMETLNQVSIRDLKDDINKLETQIKKERKFFLRQHNAEISKQKREKFLAEQRELKKAREEKIRQLQQAPLSDEAVAEIIENIADNLDWLVDKHGERVKVKATAMNFKEIFSNDPNIKDLFAYDEFQQAIVFAKKPTWKKDNSCVGEMWQDIDDSELRIYLRETYQELAHETMTYDYLNSYAQKKSFHVVKDYFADLPEWDGIKRAEELFIKFLNVDDPPYSREVTKIFLLAAMARIYHPGCNFQSALVLQGAQSIGKSYVFEQLGGKWHTTLSDNVDDPHAVDALQNSWIVEMKEFSAARKADVNALKSFIERSADNRRAAYERRAKISKRHCVFAITVNDEQFLRDQTGNRRFWILKCKSKMFEIVEGLTDEYIQQVWAEMKKLYAETFADGFDDKKLQLSFDSKRRAEEIADGFMQDDGMKGEIEAFLQMKIPYQAIWKLLTKEQRRKFIADSSIMFLECDLMALHEANRKISNEKEFYDAIDSIINGKKGGIKIEDNDKNLVYYKIYGVELRQSICAAEILNECFGNGDRRKSSPKINEILPKIEGWREGKRQSHYSGYGDQKKIFYRIANDDEDENEELQNGDYEPNEEENFSDGPQVTADYAIDEDNDKDDDDFPF